MKITLTTIAIAGVLLVVILAIVTGTHAPLGSGQHVPVSGQTSTAPGPVPGDLEGDLGRPVGAK